MSSHLFFYKLKWAFLWLTSAVPNHQEFMQRVDLGKTLLTNLQKCLVTLATRKWLLSYMDPCMILCIWLVTNRTGKWSFTWFSSLLDILICRQGMIKNKLFFTVGARKGLLYPVERGKFQKSSSKIYGAHAMVFQAQISNFIEFGPEMAQRNGLKVFGLFCTFPWF